MMIITSGGEGGGGEESFAADVHAQTMRCRAEHHCNALPFADGPLLTESAAGCHRILELGCGLGYATLWLTRGNAAQVDVIEWDELHTGLAWQNYKRYGIESRVLFHHGGFADVLPVLSPGYDLALYDGAAPELDIEPMLSRLLRVGGVLISANLPLRDMGALFGGGWDSSYAGADIVHSVRV